MITRGGGGGEVANQLHSPVMNALVKSLLTN